MGRGNFEGQKGLPIVKYRDFLPCAERKRLNQFIFHLGCGLKWAEGAQVQSYSPCGANVLSWEDTLRLNHKSTVAMRLASNYFDQLLS